MRPNPWTLDTARAAGTCCLVVVLAASAGQVRADERGEEVVLSIDAGEVRDFVLRLGNGDLPELRAELGRPADLPEDLRVGFTTPESPQPDRWPDEPLKLTTMVPAGGEVHLRTMARRCSGKSSYRVPLRLSTASPVAGGPAELPILIQVHPGAPCGGLYAETAVAAASPVLLALVLFCCLRMWQRSEFLRPAALASKVRPLSWQVTGATQVDGRGAGAAESQVLHGLAWRRRLSVWMKSWRRRLRKKPWLAFRGGEPYRERVRLELGNRYDAIALVPVPEEDQGASERGSLYAVAAKDGGIRFMAVTGPDGTVGGMEIEPAPTSGRTEVHLPGRTQLLHRGSFDEDPTGPAGWRIG